MNFTFLKFKPADIRSDFSLSTSTFDSSIKLKNSNHENGQILFRNYRISNYRTVSYANTGYNKALIQQKSENAVNLKAQLRANDKMLVVITNEDGDVILHDEIENQEIVNKTYDFSEARYGGYYMEIFVNDELIKATVIGDKAVTIQDSYFLAVN